MTALTLGRLERVELRAGWTHEAASFTPWLAQAENLRLLGDTLGLNLELEGTKANVGPFRADILCRDVEADRLVLIENQLERTDHGMGGLLPWREREPGAVYWVARRLDADPIDETDWPRQHGFLCETLQRFSEVLEPHLASYRATAPSLTSKEFRRA